MKFVLFRHAHKAIMPFDDPELSPKGFDQAHQILNLIKNNTLPRPTALIVSPKRRTSQTFYALSKDVAVSLKVDSNLDQRHSDETSQSFHQRIFDFFNKLSELYQENDIVFACTHYDVIEEAMLIINSDRDLTSFEFTQWAPTQFAYFEILHDQWHFIKKGEAK